MLRKLRHPAVALVAALSLLVPLAGAAAEVCTASMEMEDGTEPSIVAHGDHVLNMSHTAVHADHADDESHHGADGVHHAAGHADPAADHPHEGVEHDRDGAPCRSDDCRSGAEECAVTACVTAPPAAGQAVADDPGPPAEDAALTARLLLADAHRSILIPPPRN